MADLQAIQGERRAGEGVPGRVDLEDVVQVDRPPERAAANEQIRRCHDIEGLNENPDDKGVQRDEESEDRQSRAGLCEGHHGGDSERVQSGGREDDHKPSVALRAVDPLGPSCGSHGSYSIRGLPSRVRRGP